PENDRYDREFSIFPFLFDKATQEGLDFLVLPGSLPAVTDEYRHRSDVLDLLLQLLLPGKPRANVPQVEPGQKPILPQLLADLDHRRRILPVVAEENVEVIGGFFA